MDSTAGFVLTGGRSSRMGRDKALLSIEGAVLVTRTAERVRAAAGSVTLIGAPERYAHLNLPAVADLVPAPANHTPATANLAPATANRGEACGPIGGLYTALAMTSADWNLLVACDMPGLTTEFLRELLEVAAGRGTACLVPETASGLHPLCAVYHRRNLAVVKSAINDKRFKMHDLLRLIQAVPWPVADARILENVNTPLQWEAR
jgi:molybdopterin-guanine dinucleotide biosynthesis protein A